MSCEPLELFSQTEDGVVVPVEHVEFTRVEGVHPFERDNRAQIAENWSREIAANPRLYNGRMMLPAAAWIERGVLAGVSHEIDFATFLYWRRQAVSGGSCHLFAFAIPVASDGALVAVRMGPHTANPGRVYFAAGSFEAIDYPDGRMDFDANTRREVLEETGLDLAGTRREAGFHLLRAGASALLFRRHYLEREAEEIAADIRAHVARDPDPEIEGPVILRKGDVPAPTVRHMPPLLAWHFGEGG